MIDEILEKLEAEEEAAFKALDDFYIVMVDTEEDRQKSRALYDKWREAEKRLYDFLESCGDGE